MFFIQELTEAQVGRSHKEEQLGRSEAEILRNRDHEAEVHHYFVPYPVNR